MDLTGEACVLDFLCSQLDLRELEWCLTSHSLSQTGSWCTDCALHPTIVVYLLIPTWLTGIGHHSSSIWAAKAKEKAKAITAKGNTYGNLTLLHGEVESVNAKYHARVEKGHRLRSTTT